MSGTNAVLRALLPWLVVQPWAFDVVQDENILYRKDPCNFQKTDFETIGIIIVRPVIFLRAPSHY